jgi:hypothetical protein
MTDSAHDNGAYDNLRLLFLAAVEPGEPERVIWATKFDPELLPLTIKLPLNTDVDSIRVERVNARQR